MPADYTALAGPSYFLFIGVEIWTSQHHQKGYYRINDSINDMNTGILMQLGLLLGTSLTVAGYLFIYKTVRIFELAADSPLAGLILFSGFTAWSFCIFFSFTTLAFVMQVSPDHDWFKNHHSHSPSITQD
jgi:uncharacterized BrkB/YihY/UPF0761 family membrane protein